MDGLEFLIIIVVLCALLFLIYYFISGQKGNISISSPVESRVDEYLDRRFQSIVDEWQLVTRSKLETFTEPRYKELEQDETRLVDVKSAHDGIQASLGKLEVRLDNLEKELAQKGNAKK